MNWFDYFLITVIGLSVVFAATRGFLREVVSLLAWVVAFVAATQLARFVEPTVAGMIGNAGIASIASFVGVFVAVLLVMALLGWLLQMLASSVGLSWMDRMLGMLFGFARGILVVLVGFMIYLSFQPEPPELVSRSYLAPHFVAGARQLGGLLPEGSVMLGRVRDGYATLETQFAVMGPAVAQAAAALNGGKGQPAADEGVLLVLPELDAKPKPKAGPALPTPNEAAELDRLMKDLDAKFR